jgi:tRNA pseudouridine synthase D (TruD)
VQISVARLHAVNGRVPGVRLCSFGYSKSGLQLGSLAGNLFTITLRGLSVASRAAESPEQPRGLVAGDSVGEAAARTAAAQQKPAGATGIGTAAAAVGAPAAPAATCAPPGAQPEGEAIADAEAGADADAARAAVAQAVAGLRESGFVNYFGLQRFGSGAVATHELGTHLLHIFFVTSRAYLLAAPCSAPSIVATAGCCSFTRLEERRTACIVIFSFSADRH